ncbi:26S proteasome regulatory subunit N8 [Entomortierella parvispora]|uniref:26S proteasome regulatory subunit N8 n=1 Tax=Entomortierella parvispora TaxID=205924 RepID=A0A9P3HC93_9FUNG|nr:26S proteasome regulatory subunit N8 [Entomortierella parvispora]
MAPTTTPPVAPATTVASDKNTPAAVVQSSSVTVHPLVLLSVVDHYNRVAKNTKKRALGVLLGQAHGNKVNVANSFAVPFEEDEKDPSVWFLDHNYVEAMNDMFRKVNAKERMVGWYHSGPKLRASDLEINELFKKYTPNPALVIIDVKPTDLEIPTDAYFAVEEIRDDGTATTKTFVHVPSEIEAEEAEEIGVEHLLRDIKDNVVGTLSNRVGDQLRSLKGLQQRLEEIQEYLGKVVAGSLPINHQIIYNLQDIFNRLPNLEDPDTIKSFSVKTNDQLLVIYLSSLIRSVIALHNLINNKIENKRAEEELDAGFDKDGKPVTPTTPEADAKDAKDSKDAKDGKETKDASKDTKKSK